MGFIQELIDYFNASTQNKILCIVGAAVVLIILVLIIAAIVHGAKKSKAKKKAAATAPAVSEPAEQPTSALDAAPSPSAHATPTEQETAEEPLPAEQTSDEGPLLPPLENSSESNDFPSFGMAEEPEPVAFAQQEPETAAEGPVTEETEPDAYDAAPQAEAADETPDETVFVPEPVSSAESPDSAPEADAAVPENEEETAQPEPAAEEKTKKAPAARTKQSVPAIEKSEPVSDEDRKAYTGKWVIRKNEEMGTYYFELLASNGEKLLSSIDYTSVAGARGGIKTHKANIAKGNFTIASSKSRQYFFRLLSGSKQILCTGETYKTKTRCENAIESVKRFAETAVIIVDKGEEQE